MVNFNIAVNVLVVDQSLILTVYISPKPINSLIMQIEHFSWQSWRRNQFAVMTYDTCTRVFITVLNL